MSFSMSAHAVRELAELERQIRESTAPMDVSVRITQDTVRIGYNTYEGKESTRSRLRAHIAREIIESDRWDLVTIRDGVELEDDDGYPVVGDMIDARRSD